MAADTKTVKARCLCGAVQHELTFLSSEFPLKSEFCHCNSCRRMSGNLCLTLAFLPQSYQPSEDLLAKLQTFQFSKRLTDYSCPTCGTHMLAFAWKDADDHSKGSSWDVMSGTLEKADGVFEIISHEFIGDTLDGGFTDFLPVDHGNTIKRRMWGFDTKEDVPLYWYSPDRPEVKPSPDDKLHGHCKCGGVNFWVSRPSERSKKAAGAWPDLIIPFHSNQPRPDHSGWWLRENGTKFLAGVCSCDSCRLDTGMEFIAWAFVPTIDISLDKDGNEAFKLPFGTLKEYRSSHDTIRYHCGTCNASVFYTNDDRDDLVDVAVGLLDAPEGARAETWLDWRTKRLSYREDGIKRAEAFTLAVEDGLDKFEKNHPSKTGRSS